MRVLNTSTPYFHKKIIPIFEKLFKDKTDPRARYLILAIFQPHTPYFGPLHHYFSHPT